MGGRGRCWPSRWLRCGGGGHRSGGGPAVGSERKRVHGAVVLRADQQLRAVVGDAYLSRRAPERGGVVPPRSSDRTEPGIAVNRSLALRRKPPIDPSSPALSTDERGGDR